MRLPMNANSEFEVRQYYQTRALQLASEGYTWSRELRSFKDGMAYLTWFTNTGGEVYGSFYITPQARNQGISTAVHAELGSIPIVTVADCQVSKFLTKRNIPFEMPIGAYDREAYRLVEQFYGDRRAKRSQVFLMNHIDEGVVILKWLGADPETIDAYVLHPLLQGDLELKDNFTKIVENEHVTAKSIALAMEYRCQANAWLSGKVSYWQGEYDFVGDPTAGPLSEVQQMLIADKVQNYKDFIMYHKGTHPRSFELDAYFLAWMQVLGVSDSYQAMIDNLNKLSPHN